MNSLLSATLLAEKAERKINDLVNEGWNILNVSFGTSGRGFSAFITIFR